MATKTFEELKQMAIQIRDEKTNKQNTATRIGTQMLEHLNKLEQDFLDKDTTEGKFSELEKKTLNLLFEQGLISGVNGEEVASDTRIRSSFLKAPFTITVKEGYKITAVGKYEYNQALTVLPSNVGGGAMISVQDKIFSITKPDNYLYRIVIAKTNDIEEITPNEDCIEKYVDRVDYEVNRIDDAIFNEKQELTKLRNKTLNLLFEQGSLNGNTGEEVNSATRIRSSFLKSPFIIYTKDSYKITAVGKYEYNQALTVLPSNVGNGEMISVQDKIFSITKPDNYLYRIVIAKTNDIEEITPNDNCIEKYIDRTDKYNTICYVSVDGSDNNIGTKDEPFATFQHAINLGYKNILGLPGIYKGQKIELKGKNGIKICCASGNDLNRIPPYENHARIGRIVLDNSENVTFVSDAENGIYMTKKIFSDTSNWHKVFITKKLMPERTGLRSLSYWAILWEIDANDISLCKKLKPVLTLEECKSEKGTFFYNGSSIYINPTTDLKTYKILIKEDDFDAVLIEDCEDIYIEGIDCFYQSYRGSYIDRSINCKIKDCDFGFSAYSGGGYPNMSNVDFIDCNAYHVCADGYAPTRGGNASFYNCNGFYNGDDGISHHDGSIGIIDGGYWHHNGKGGVAPAYGSNVSVKNVISTNNNYGLYLLADSGRKTNNTVTISNSIFKENVTKDIIVENYNCIIAQCVYDTISKASGSNVVIYGNVE